MALKWRIIKKRLSDEDTDLQMNGQISFAQEWFSNRETYFYPPLPNNSFRQNLSGRKHILVNTKIALLNLLNANITSLFFFFHIQLEMTHKVVNKIKLLQETPPGRKSISQRFKVSRMSTFKASVVVYRHSLSYVTNRRKWDRRLTAKSNTIYHKWFNGGGVTPTNTTNRGTVLLF